MDDWHQRLTSQLLGAGGAPVAAAGQQLPTAAAQLEIAFGYARTEVSYLLGLAQSARLPVTGNVLGDDIGVHLGTTLLRFVLSRKDASIVATIPGVETPARLTWNVEKDSMVLPDGKAIDMKDYVRSAVESTVTAYKAAPAPPPPTWGPMKPVQG